MLLAARLAAPALALTLLGACATSIPSVEVTRFHRIDAPAIAPTGTYSIAAPSNADPLSLAHRDYHVAVARQLDRLGYRSALTMAAGEADYLVTVTVDRAERSADADGSGVSVGVGGGTGGYRSGVGVGVGLDLTRLLADRRDIIATRLSVQISRSGDTLAMWEGRAESLARTGTPAAQSGLAADKLATALFADFPGRSGETISVP